MRVLLTAILVIASCGTPVEPDGGSIDAEPDDAGADAGTQECVLDPPEGGLTTPPGTVVFHIDAAGGRFVGSPSLVRVPSGALVASNDLFGLGQRDMPPTLIHRSDDDGAHWAQVAQLDGQFWSSLFIHEGALYLMGTTAEYGSVALRRSDDEGRSWTTPIDSANGLLAADAPYHTAPTPVVEVDGRIFRAFEWVREPITGPTSFEAMLLWAESGSDLLRADSWHATEHHAFPLADSGLGWLEGNPVATRDGDLVDVLRVHLNGELERAAILSVSDTTTSPTLASEPVFAPLSGASKKFTIRFDAASGRYLTLVDITDGTPSSPASVRNRLALASSPDLLVWDYHVVLLSHDDALLHGFQYADGFVEGDDLLFVSRTAYEDDAGGATSYHDTNYLTYHRLRGYRRCLERTLE